MAIIQSLFTSSGGLNCSANTCSAPQRSLSLRTGVFTSALAALLPAACLSDLEHRFLTCLPVSSATAAVVTQLPTTVKTTP